MKFLADMGISMTVVRELRQWEHDVIHVRECLPITSDDEVILDFALKEKRVILTMDHDFGDLFFRRGASSPSLIFFRVTDEKPQSILQKLRTVLDAAADALGEGAIITVEDTRFRIRPLPINLE